MHLLSFSLFASALAALVPSPGDTAIIPGWHLRSSLRTTESLSRLSQPNADTSSWHRVSSRGTVMAGLIQNGVYNETDLFYGDHLASVDLSSFQFPWIYREEVSLQPPPRGDHIFLVTHGVTSRADIFFNGAQIASSSFQQGCYGGHQYDITPHIRSGSNAILIQAYPTDYLADFGQGFADWNPYPPDNGTGVWRNVEVKHTGPVSLSPLRVLSTYNGSDTEKVAVDVKTDVTNHENGLVTGVLQGVIQSEDGSQTFPFSCPIRLQKGESTTIAISVSVKNPRIWWPAAWGQQPLYVVQANVTINDQLADRARTTLGIRSVAASLSRDSDISFTVNGSPFQVLGAGYAPDIFLRFDADRVRTILQYMEHPELYDLADRMGVMIMAGWECCDKWEGWEYNDDANGLKWNDTDYHTAESSMLHEAQHLQPHPSLLAFLIGSDYWPNDRATSIYTSALHRMDWPNPIVSSAAQRGYPSTLGPSGMKMLGPYDWVPPNYWSGSQRGAAFGFGSEQGAGVGTPELSSLRRFLSPQDLNTLWNHPNANLFHMSRSDSQFHTRSIYNAALTARYGPPSSLPDYIFKAQLMDYEATRAEFESFSIRQSAPRPATGVIYWMLNSAWPNLHWQLFDYYLHPAGAYYGTKIGTRIEHVAYDPDTHEIHLINHSLDQRRERVVVIDLMDHRGNHISTEGVRVNTAPITSKQIARVKDKVIPEMGFLRLLLQDTPGAILSRNVYWVSNHMDKLDWEKSNWYTTPVTEYANFTALSNLQAVELDTTVRVQEKSKSGLKIEVTLENRSKAPGFFIRLVLVDAVTGDEVVPVYWEDNYLTVFAEETVKVSVWVHGGVREWRVVMEGGNIQHRVIGEGK
ncbi:putative beta-mannosidase [Aspergillus sclerotioniger CBS 115572]|uniref:Putative beta-mannosidase n=1 Tax=Aspergillus sclerotioniger CBS 115572 TaxID=1450535 RepID=A0A317XDJ6_9EURO|nr:putative beta-mannosidase [Aspergillus sclerotioniger CBS 115572]PWY94988.1 putative beta-mannosidase [Aspergillus sclerotioniger CBS 115572]